MAEEVVSLVAKLEDNVSNAAYRVIKALDDIGDKARSAAPKVKALEEATDEEANAAKNAAAANYLNAKAIGKMGKEALRTEIKMRLLERRMKKMARAGAMGGRGGKGGGGGGGLGLVAGGVGGMPITMFIAAASTVAALLPALAAGVGAIGAAAMGAVGALAPLTGLLIAYPGYLAALGQGLAVTKMAFSGVGEAVKVLTDPGSSLEDINIAMNKLGPSGQQFAQTIAGMKGDLDGLKRTIQAALLPAFNELANTARSYMPMVEGAFASTAVAISSATRSLSDYLKQTRTQGQVGQILSNNTEIVRQFSAAGVSGIKILVDLLTAAGPMLIQISKDIRGFIDRLSQASSTNTSGLSDFFQSTYSVLRQTVDIATDFVVALFNIARIGTPLGSAMGDSFAKMAENFRTFTESSSGIQKIRDWFIEMTPVVYEIGYLIRDVSRALFGLGSNGNAFITISQALRQDLLPVIMEFIGHVSESLIPTLLDLITTVTQFFTAIDPLRFIIPIVVAIGGAFKVVLEVIKAGGPVVQFLVGALVAMIFTIKIAIVALNMLRIAKLRAAMAARTLGVSIRTMMISAGAIGAILTVVGTAIMLFTDAANNAEDAADGASGATDDWARSLFDLNGALSENYKQTIAAEAAERGLFDILNQIGVDGHGLLIDAISGNKDAMVDLLFQLKQVEQAGTGLNKYGEIEMTDTAKAARSLSDQVKAMAGEFGGAASTAGQVEYALSQTSGAMATTKTAADKLADSMRELDKFFIDRQSERAYRQDLRDLRKTFSELGDEYGKNQLKTDQMDASLDQFIGNQMARANKLAEEGKYDEAFKVIDRASKNAMDVLTKNLGPEGAAAAFDPIKAMIDDTLASLRALEREQITLKVGTQGYVPMSPTSPTTTTPPNRFAGGPIVGGKTYTIGELGPEAFVGRDGNVSLIGKNGPEVMRFGQSGYVVPNHVLGGVKDSSVPSGVMSALANAVQTRTPSGSSSEYDMGDRPINVHIGSITQATEFDVAKAIKKGILEAERNRRERS